jgi:serine/threonine-protein kinase
MTSQARLVGGRYEEGESLGRGGMADVRKGIDNRLGRTVAIKRLRIDLASDPTFQARFRREAQSAAALNHPSIVAVYDTGEEPDPNGSGITIPYIVMEYVQGKTLRDMLREGRKIMTERALEITSGVLEALDYSHRAGIVHRDIKPGNVMLNQYGAVKVMDFGIARAVADTSATMTQTAAVIGTAQYLSPEQARGETVDFRSDLYSTGCLLYELLTGRPPFVGESPVSVAYQHVRENPAPPSSYDPSIPPEVDAVVLKALAKDREQRYQSAAEMRADVHRILAGQQVTAPLVAVAETRALYGATALEEQEPVGDLVAYGPDDETPDDRDGRGRGFAYFLLGLAIVALAVGGYLLWDRLANDNTPAVTQVQVPSLIGKTKSEAISELSAVGLELGTTRMVNSTDFDEGQILAQDPKALSKADPNTKVNVTISAGEGKIQVPDVVGKTAEEATQLLSQAGFNVKQIPTNNSQKAGTVIDASPTGAQPRGTEISLKVANGKVRVPDVVDLPEDQATQQLKDAGFVVAPVETTSNKPPGVVARQDPVGGKDTSWADKGSKVTIFISRNQQPPTTPPTSPTTAPTTPPTSPTTPPSGGQGPGGTPGPATNSGRPSGAFTDLS